MAEAQPPVQPPYQPGPPMPPHRGTMILVFGIVGFLPCCLNIVFGILAWVLGAQDLRAMDSGQMDPSGRGMTQAGWVLGIISVCLSVLGLIATVIWSVVFGSILAHAPGLPAFPR